MDFSLSPDLQALELRVREFVRREVIPLENDPRQDVHGPTQPLIEELRARARAAGLYALHAPSHYGGIGLSHLGRAVVYEAAGYSLFGPLALHCMPGEGDHHMLEMIANDAQKDRWLKPLLDGTVRSTFAMTEPDGAGADPSQLKTLARPDGQDYVLNGRKWFITSFAAADFHLVMAQTADTAGRTLGATMFVVDSGTPGLTEVRRMETLDDVYVGGHSEIAFENVRVTRDRILGEVGQGFRYAQVRLCPARLTHCMRWLGAAQRAHDIAVDYARRRTAFGKVIGEHEGVSFQLADNLMDLHHCRLAVRHAAWLLDQGHDARRETSMCKVYCSEKLGAVVDRAVQVMGGSGISHDTAIARIYRNIRPFRLYDGPSEVHRWAMGRDIMKGIA
ncbi:MAG: acyl-CoA dehydrogenase family protein [Gammaproteobacteria bacterium]